MKAKKPKTEQDMDEALRDIRYRRMSQRERVYMCSYERVVADAIRALGFDARYIGLTSQIRPWYRGVVLNNYLKVSHGAIWYAVHNGRPIWMWQPW